MAWWVQTVGGPRGAARESQNASVTGVIEGDGSSEPDCVEGARTQTSGGA